MSSTDPCVRDYGALPREPAKVPHEREPRVKLLHTLLEGEVGRGDEELRYGPDRPRGDPLVRDPGPCEGFPRHHVDGAIAPDRLVARIRFGEEEVVPMNDGPAAEVVAPIPEGARETAIQRREE